MPSVVVVDTMIARAWLGVPLATEDLIFDELPSLRRANPADSEA